MVIAMYDELRQAAQLVAGFEGFRAAPYLDAGGVPTIGYGLTHYPSGMKVRLDDQEITEAEALSDMQAILRAEVAPQVLESCPGLSGPRLVACLSFAYNVGCAAFAKSTLARLINAGDYAGAAGEFDKWTKAAGKTLGGLISRRAKEREIFEGAA